MSPNQTDHDETHIDQGIAKIVRMANQIGTFFESKQDRAEGVHGIAEHINKFWEPRMRRHFFEVFDAGGEGFKPIVLEAAAQIRRPSQPISPEHVAEANADVSG